MGLWYDLKSHKFNFWDRTSFMWHKRQKLYAFIYLVAAATFFYFGLYLEGLLALILTEMRISRREQRYG
jgi:hypothetical protein